MSSAEHFCQYIVKWPMNQDDTTIRCDAPAAIKSTYQGLNGWTFQWLCADHYDHIQMNLAKVGLSHD